MRVGKGKIANVCMGQTFFFIESLLLTCVRGNLSLSTFYKAFLFLPKADRSINFPQSTYINIHSASG